MAQYRCSLKPRISRSKGESVVRSASYITRSALHDERTGETFDYSRKKKDLLFAGIYAPKDAPEWTKDISKFVNEIERTERYKNAQLALPVELSLPHELTTEQNRWLLQDWIKENVTREGYACLATIHKAPEDGDERNVHAHLLITLRKMDENGFAKTKKIDQQQAYLSRRDRTEQMRESWERHLKHHLERHGFHEQAAAVSCKSLNAQGVEREPQIHIGPDASAMERNGRKTDRGAKNQEIKNRNRQLERLQAAEKELTSEITEAQRQLDKEKQAKKQKFQEINAATSAAIKKTWESTPRDALAFMIALNERRLYVVQAEKGNYAAMAPNGYVHYWHNREIDQAIDALRREHSELMLPNVAEQREQLEIEKNEKTKRRMAHTASTLYNHASMPSMQRDALIHIRDKQIQKEIARREQKRKQETENLQKKEMETKPPVPKAIDQQEEKRQHKRDTTEQTEAMRRRQEREYLRASLGLRKQGDRERDDGGGRERER